MEPVRKTPGVKKGTKTGPSVIRHKPPQITVHPLVEELRAARVNKGYTLKDLAKKSGYHWRTFEKWENGSAQPRLVAFIDVCKALGIRVVLEGEDGEIHDGLNRTIAYAAAVTLTNIASKLKGVSDQLIGKRGTHGNDTRGQGEASDNEAPE